MRAELRRALAVALDPSLLMAAAGLTPDPWQRDILRTRPRRGLLCCARQVGKSVTVAAAALHEALYEPGSLVLMVAPSLRQSSELLRKTRELAGALGAAASPMRTAITALEFPNGSRVLALPGTPDTIRGYSSVSLVLIDEAAFIDETLPVAVEPMLAVCAGRLIALSTPCGKRGWFYESWRSEEDWQRVRVPASDCPRIPADELARAQRTMTRAAFASEYQCEFVDALDTVFRQDDIAAALDPTLDELFEEEW
jgi:terminase large subunit-like protein